MQLSTLYWYDPDFILNVIRIYLVFSDAVDRYLYLYPVITSNSDTVFEIKHVHLVDWFFFTFF